jgi:DNA-binding MarR family transcriptional regulator
MVMGIINDLGIIALASRLERLSETLRKEAALLYKENGLGKLKWYLVLYVIGKSAPIGVNELATELSFAHPSVIQTLHELEFEKLIKSAVDKKDSRRRLVSLTAKGKKFLENVTPLVESFKTALAKVLDTENNLLKALNEVEIQLQEESFYKRVKRIHKI